MHAIYFILPCFYFLSLLLLCGCSNATPVASVAETGPPWFEEITDRVGLKAHLHVEPTESYQMPQVMGSGLAVIDIDNDGRFDLVLLNNMRPGSPHTHRLFRQTAEGRFVDATAGSGLDFSGHGMGVAVGDFDNDGFADLYISQYGGGRLFHNRGNGTFEDVTRTAGVELRKWGTSCTFVDYDRDGWLDLVVVNYVDYDPSLPCIESSGKQDFCHPNRFSGSASRLFRNRGRGSDGRWQGYTDESANSGIASKPSNGLGIVAHDFNQDGWPDLLIANDAKPNHLWINQKNGTFQEEAMSRGIAYDAAGAVRANMGVALADLFHQNRGDIFITHLSEELHTLWKQSQPGQFRDVTSTSGLAKSSWRGTGFGTIALDFNHDGQIDLAIANGRVSRARYASPGIRAELPEFWREYAERNQLFENTGDSRFRDVSLDSPAFTGAAEVNRGLAWADLDGDGAMDLITTSIEGPVRVYKNVAPKKGHWLLVRAFDLPNKRDAIGATVRLITAGKSRLGFANPGQSYCSSGDPRAHFGLGSLDKIDEIQIDWPDGSRESFPGGVVDRIVTCNRGQGNTLSKP